MKYLLSIFKINKNGIKFPELVENVKIEVDINYEDFEKDNSNCIFNAIINNYLDDNYKGYNLLYKGYLETIPEAKDRLMNYDITNLI